MAYRKQAVSYLAKNDPNMKSLYPTNPHRMKYFHKTKELCLETAKEKGIFPNQNVIVIVNDDNIAMFCTEEGILLTPQYYITSTLAHEMVHSFRIGHSYSNRLVRIYPHSAIGEYDDLYDLMSTANAYMYPSPYGFSGPGLNGPHLEYLGWLPMDRTRYFGLKGENEEVVELASLSLPHNSTRGILLLQLPYDQCQPNHVFTIELRTRHKHDVGIKRNAIIIRKLTEGLDKHLFSYLITNDVKQRHEWLEGDTWTVFISANMTQFIEMKVHYIDPRNNTAKIRVRTTFNPAICNRRSSRKADITKLAATEPPPPVTTFYDKNNGCPKGFRPRLTGPKEKVCIPESTPRSKADAKNKFFALKTWGLNRCQSEYVWRSIDAYDYVCVLEWEHAKSQDQSRAACEATSVRRNAFPSDRACVSLAERDESEQESWRGRSKLEYRKFFNGVDDVL